MAPRHVPSPLGPAFLHADQSGQPTSVLVFAVPNRLRTPLSQVGRRAGRLTDRHDCMGGRGMDMMQRQKADGGRAWHGTTRPGWPAVVAPRPKPRQNKLTAGMRPWCGLRSTTAVSAATHPRETGARGRSRRSHYCGRRGWWKVFLSAHSGEAVFRCRRAQDPNPRSHAGQGAEEGSPHSLTRGGREDGGLEGAVGGSRIPLLGLTIWKQAVRCSLGSHRGAACA